MKEFTKKYAADKPASGMEPKSRFASAEDDKAARDDAATLKAAAIGSHANDLSAHAADQKRGTQASKEAHAAAGVEHLRAASAHAALGNSVPASRHREEASFHADKAGSEWNEEKHPRDENGKFT